MSMATQDKAHAELAFLDTASLHATVPFVAMLGFELVGFDNGTSEVVFDVKPEHHNHSAMAHGGAIMTLMDVTLAMAARSARAGMRVVTIELKTSFMRAAAGRLTGKGRLLHATKNMAFAEATIFDTEGRACAHATGTFKYVPDPHAASGLPVSAGTAPPPA